MSGGAPPNPRSFLPVRSPLRTKPGNPHQPPSVLGLLRWHQSRTRPSNQAAREAFSMPGRAAPSGVGSLLLRRPATTAVQSGTQPSASSFVPCWQTLSAAVKTGTGGGVASMVQTAPTSVVPAPQVTCRCVQGVEPCQCGVVDRAEAHFKHCVFSRKVSVAMFVVCGRTTVEQPWVDRWVLHEHELAPVRVPPPTTTTTTTKAWHPSHVTHLGWGRSRGGRGNAGRCRSGRD